MFPIRHQKTRVRDIPYATPTRSNTAVPESTIVSESYFEKKVPWTFEERDSNKLRPITIVKPFHRSAITSPESPIPMRTEKPPDTPSPANKIDLPPEVRRIKNLGNVLDVAQGSATSWPLSDTLPRERGPQPTWVPPRNWRPIAID